jgi:glycogen synthase
LRLSIVINTFNREPFLRPLLATLGRLTGCEYEVIVVNGPSTDGTARLLEAYRGRVKRVDTDSRNLAHSRNLGIAAASGDVVAFIDDDALPMDPLWGARYVDAFAQDREGRLGCLGGPAWHHDTPWKEFDGGLTDDYGFQVFDIAKGAPRSGRWWPRPIGCNCAFRREALVAVGGFDEYFAYYHDETDLCVRLARAGYATRHLPENGVRHYAATSERRTNKYDRNWDVVARSDIYYALKNGGDAWPIRIARTIASAPRKHYFRDINSYFLHGEITPAHWMRLLRKWGRGARTGFAAGLRRGRALGSFQASPPAFQSFALDRRLADEAGGPPLSIVLLVQIIPGQPGCGGIGRYTYDLARGLHERGHTVHLICRSESEIVHSTPGFTVHGITSAALAAVRTDLTLPVAGKNMRYAIAVAQKVRAIEATGERIDLIHATNWDCEGLALIRAKLHPVVLTLVSPLSQVIEAEQWPITPDLDTALAMDRWQIRAADAVVVPSQGVLKSYASPIMGIDAGELSNLSIVPLGIVPDQTPAPAASANGRRRRLLFVGRLERRKGIHILLDALPGLMARFPGWDCHIAGDNTILDGDGATHQAKFVARHKGAAWLERVHFTGVLSDAALKEEYRACDLFVAPSLFESFGLMFHEAMQYGKAVIGCRTGGVPETVADGQEGLLVSPGHVEELAGAMATLMADDAMRQRLGAAGRERVQARQNVTSMTIGFETVYRSVLDRLGEARTRRRRLVWKAPVSLAEEGGEYGLQRSGAWQFLEAIPGAKYLVAEEPGSSLSLRVPQGSTLEITALRHSWSGVLAVFADDTLLQLINLYREGAGLDPAFLTRIPLPSAAGSQGPNGQNGHPYVRLRLEVQPEKHPASAATQVWVRQVVCREPIAVDAL